MTAELSAVKVTNPTAGAYIFDFAQNAAGHCRLQVNNMPPGTRLQIRHAEALNPDGTLFTANYRTARATDSYICRGGTEIWSPEFTYRGFRYAEITGYPGTPPKNTLVFEVFNTATTPTGTFNCANTMLNKLWQNITWSQRSNMHSLPTDCPQRDERLGWTADTQVFASTACWNMDMARFYAKFTRFGPKCSFGPGWDDEAIITPWTLYQFYGDTRIIQQTYDDMVRLVESRHGQASNGLFEQEGYGDWIAVVE